jgi:hypothetical protein
MKVALGTFVQSALKARLGAEIGVGVQAALLHYARRINAGWKPADYPRFRRELPPEDGEVDLELVVDPEVELVLKNEVQRQGISLEELTTHAVFVYLADLDRLSQPGGSSMPMPLA